MKVLPQSTPLRLLILTMLVHSTAFGISNIGELDNAALFSFSLQSDNKGYDSSHASSSSSSTAAIGQRSQRMEAWIPAHDEFCLGVGDHVFANRDRWANNVMRDNDFFHNHYYPIIGDHDNDTKINSHNGVNGSQDDWGRGWVLFESLNNFFNRENWTHPVIFRQKQSGRINNNGTMYDDELVDYYARRTHHGFNVHIIATHFGDESVFADRTKEWMMDKIYELGSTKTNKDIIIVLAHAAGNFFRDVVKDKHVEDGKQALSQAEMDDIMNTVDMVNDASDHIYRRHNEWDGDYDGNEAILINTGALDTGAPRGYVTCHVLDNPPRFTIQYIKCTESSRKLHVGDNIADRVDMTSPYLKVINGPWSQITNWNNFQLGPIANDSQFVSQNVPTSMDPGETRSVQVTIKNTGEDTWSGANGHKLGSESPRDNSLWTGANRVDLSSSVSSGNNHTFTFNITAPTTPGHYDFQWRMVDDSGTNVGWFGAYTPKVVISVGDLYDTTGEAGTLTYNAVNSPASEGPENSIDDNVNTKYLTGDTSTFLQYQYSGGLKKVCTAYSITSANDVPSRDPETAVFKGSNDGSNWTTLDSRSGLNFAGRFEKQFFGATNSTAYEYYRLEMTCSDPSRLQLAEIEFLAEGTGPTNPPEPSLDPIRIEAENWDNMFGVATQATGDTGGGDNVKNIDIGDWMEYNVNLPTSGAYEVRFRLASQSRGSHFDFKVDGNTLTTIDEPATGDFQVYATVTANVNISAGSRTLRLEALDSNWNINWIELVPPGGSSNTLPEITSNPVTSVEEGSNYSYTLTATDADGDSLTLSAPTRPGWLNFNAASGVLSGTPSNANVGDHAVTLRAHDGTSYVDQPFTITVTAIVVPGGDPIRIEAENYDAMLGIATQTTGDTGGGQNVKDISTGDWMDYNITLPASGSYEARFRVASLTRGMQFDFMEGSTVLASFDEPATGAWQTYTTVTANVNLTAGSTTLRVAATDSNWNFNWFELVPPVGASNAAPVITSSPSLSVNEGDNYSYTLTATDADGDSITYSYITKPDWLNFNAGTGELSGIPYGNRVGNHNVTLRASDGTDHDEESFVINVVASPVPLGPEGYVYCADEHQNFTLPQASDLAYGAYGQFVYLTNQTGTVTFNNPSFGSDPISGTGKYGFYKVIADSQAPTPNPAGFTVSPYATGTTSIRMIATTGSDLNGVEYYFEETTNNSGGNDSGWQSSAVYEDTGLSSTTQYGYRVKMRDSLGNETSRSITYLATTDTPPDSTPPNPNPMSFAVAPAPVEGDPLGVLSAGTLSGNNPATGAPWAPGDTYRVVFLTSTTRDAASHNIADYNAFVQSVADAAGLGSASWKVIGSTGSSDARDNTATNTASNGTGEAIFLVDGSTVIANNYADLWDGSIDALIDMDENGTAGYDVSPATGSTATGVARDRHLGGSDEATPKIEYGDSTKTSGQWALIYNGLPMGQYHFYALSDPITIVDPSGDPETMISMTATTATDLSGVEYYFSETSGNPGGSDSGWQSSPTYIDTGLTPGTQYTYTVVARDLSVAQNITAASASASATTDSGSTGTDFENWKTTNNVVDDMGDDDGDGLDNLTEFALGGDPKSGDADARAPQLSRSSSNLEISFRRNESSVTYIIEKSSDLVNWTEHVTVTDVHGLVGNNATVTVSDTEMSNGKLFLRLKMQN